MIKTQIDQTAARLEAIGVKAGDRVVILAPSSPACAVLVTACWRISAVVTPLSPRYPASTVNAILTDLQCSVFVAAEPSTTAPDAVSVHRLDDLSPPCNCEFEGLLLDDLDIDQSNESDIIMTSGSTAGPKGVLHTISNHYHNALGAHENTPFGPGHRWLMSLPMHHVSGLSLLMRAMLHGGGVVFPNPDEDMAQALANCDITHISVVPVQLSRLLESPEAVERLRKLELILVGGSATPVSLIDRSLALGLPIRTTYGSTEMASQIATTAEGALADKPTSSGRILPWRTVKIADDGQIMVKGPCLFKGYVRGGQLHLPLDPDGFFATGDLGRLDDEGELYVEGRKDLMFISGGENIHPEQIERLLESVETVRRAVVVPVSAGPMGERPVAFVETADGGMPDGAVLTDRLRLHLEGFKTPTAFLQLPREMSQAGKIDRVGLRKLAEELMKGR